jgi:putative transposase
MKYPGEVYTPSVREYTSPAPPEYPYHDKTIQVTRCGRICIEGRKINLSTVFAGQFVGIREVSDKIWLFSFMGYDLGFFDEESNKVDPAENPFMEKLLPMSSV